MREDPYSVRDKLCKLQAHGFHEANLKILSDMNVCVWFIEEIMFFKFVESIEHIMLELKSDCLKYKHTFIDPQEYSYIFDIINIFI